MASDVTYLDADNYMGGGYNKDGLTFKAICLNQLSRLTVKGTTEWHGGYWSERPAINGSNFKIKVYIPDTRKEFINGVNTLFDILSPHFDKQMKEESEKFHLEYEDFRQQKINDFHAEENKNAIVKMHYLDYCADYYRKLFRCLNLLLYRLGYLEAKTFEEEV